jgi:acyl carrier protein
MDKSKHEIIINILREKLSLPENILGKEYWDLPLTGKHFRLTGVDLVYLFFELEKALGIRINDKSLENYGFGTINRIAVALS